MLIDAEASQLAFRFISTSAVLAALWLFVGLTVQRGRAAAGRRYWRVGLLCMVLVPALAVSGWARIDAPVGLPNPQNLDLLNSAILVWLCGVMLMSARLMADYLNLHAQILQTSEAPAALRLRLDALRAEAGFERRVRLVIASGTTSPWCAGVMRPVVVLPERANSWNQPTLTAVLMHELIHLQRHDPLQLLATRMLVALNWCLPWMWWLERALHENMEHTCDDRAAACLGSKDLYVDALLTVARSTVASTPRMGTGLTDAAALRERVHRLMAGESQDEQTERVFWSAALSAGMALLIGCANVTEQPAPPPSASQTMLVRYFERALAADHAALAQFPTVATATIGPFYARRDTRERERRSTPRPLPSLAFSCADIGRGSAQNYDVGVAHVVGVRTTLSVPSTCGGEPFHAVSRDPLVLRM